MRSIMWVCLSLLTAIGTCSGTIASSTNNVLSFAPYFQFTVPSGAAVSGCLYVLGYGSVREFQNMQGLSVDGVIGPRTWATIEGLLAVQGCQFSTSNSPLAICLAEIPSGISVSLSNNTKTVLLLQGSETEQTPQSLFQILVHCRYSDTDSSGRESLSSRDIWAHFPMGTEIEEAGIISTNLCTDRLFAFDGCKVWAECVVVCSNSVFHTKSNTLVILKGKAGRAGQNNKL